MPLKELEVRYATKRFRDYKLADGQGLYLLVRPNGSRLWRMKYRFDGKEKLLSFGRYPEVSLAQARLRCAEARLALARGEDPGPKAAAPIVSFEVAARAWHDNRVSALEPGHAARILSRLERDVFPAIGQRDLKQISAADVLDMLRAVEARGALDVIGGLSGTGKSTLARALGGSIGGAPGARILRSDVLRKRLAGVEPEVRLAAGDYTQDASEKVYDDMGRLAGETLARGQSVIADAVFAKPNERQSIAAVAQTAGCAFDGVWLNVDTEERVRRVAARTIDASDADAGVARAQTALNDQGSTRWGTLEAGGDFSLLEAAARIALNLDARSRNG
jgi:predicted kinase